MPSVKTAFPLQDKFWLPGGAEGSGTYAVFDINSPIFLAFSNMCHECAMENLNVLSMQRPLHEAI
ncbi:hypothetical protein CLV50_1674 [Flavobacterium lindanitolerans]|uniref:Uncharacterized protein n=1 Tax=Flavobacterium lindanitolerans TaxID=428988 RepID=A0A497UP37_9FLAO|nr:hypothetical protein B0G92_2376 [Flavobacterium lindanitolerans]RLJ30268.1 hypothetical protein CLV50_1674 [Flavobacterium lindanitolerans]